MLTPHLRLDLARGAFSSKLGLLRTGAGGISENVSSRITFFQRPFRYETSIFVRRLLKTLHNVLRIAGL